MKITICKECKNEMFREVYGFSKPQTVYSLCTNCFSPEFKNEVHSLAVKWRNKKFKNMIKKKINKFDIDMVTFWLKYDMEF